MVRNVWHILQSACGIFTRFTTDEVTGQMSGSQQDCEACCHFFGLFFPNNRVNVWLYSEVTVILLSALTVLSQSGTLTLFTLFIANRVITMYCLKHCLSVAPAVGRLLSAVRTTTPMFVCRAFTVSGPVAWNSLPNYIRDPTRSFDSFSL